MYPVRVRVRVFLFGFASQSGKFRSAQLGGGSAPRPPLFLPAAGDAPGRGSFLAGWRDWIVQATSGFFARLEISLRPRHPSRNESRTSWIQSNYDISRLA